MKTENLKSLIYKNYLKTALTSLIFIELALIIIYFNANDKIAQTSIDFILQDIKKSIDKGVQHATNHLSYKFKDIEQDLRLLQNEHQNFFQYFDHVNIPNNVQFKYAYNGMYYKAYNNGGSSVVVSRTTPITPQMEKKLMATELFDASLKTIVESNPLIVAGYFNSHDNLNRYYPYIHNSFEAFPIDIQMKNYNFYYEADAKHNPKRDVVWTDVYLDPAGQGWMLSAIVPIYNKNFLEGVTGLDVTVESIIQGFLDFELPYEGSSFLINEEGKVIALTRQIAEILKVEKFKRYIYAKGEKIDNTIYKQDSVNILEYKNAVFTSNLKKVLAKSSFEPKIKINNQTYMMFTQVIEKTNWHLISLINEDNIVKKVRELESDYRQYGYIIIALITLFYLIFFVYLYFKAQNFVKVINTPLRRIIDLTKDLGVKKHIQPIQACGIDEIDALSYNFNELSHELDHRQEQLVESEIKRKQTEEKAITDALTQVYNRHFLDTFSHKYLQIIKRENTDMSLLLIDIDNFKTVNDTYGHDHGDKIIIELVRILKDTIRENDVIVRLGGDEFVILLPNTCLHNAKLVAQKLNDHINQINQLKAKDIQFTISIGCAQNEKNDNTIEQLIKRADIALYQAKSMGKNSIA